jgi:hypothetical protein
MLNLHIVYLKDSKKYAAPSPLVYYIVTTSNIGR